MNKELLIKLFTKYMIVIGVLGHLLFYLQAYKIFSTGSATNVSAQGFSIALFSVTNWLIYGLIKKDIVLITANIVAMIGASLVLIGIFIY
jgi:MtN3 and saliva related transmembrane protein